MRLATDAPGAAPDRPRPAGMATLSRPSVNVRAPPPPQKKSVTAPTYGSPGGLGATNIVPPTPGVQLACASPRYFSEASIIFANACATTSCVDSVPMID